MLAELQQTLARAILMGEVEALLGRLAPGPVPALAALAVHRDTALGGIAQALRLAFPTVDRLVGGDFFDQAAVAYARAAPPTRAGLGAHAEGFPAFLGGYAPAADLAYLADVARFDLALEIAGTAARGPGTTVELDAATRLELEASLRLERFDWPVDLIREVLDAGDEEGLSAIEMTRRPRAFALWRGPAGATSRALSPASAVFLEALLAGEDAEAAATRAAALDDPDLFSRLQSEVIGAGFSRLQLDQKETP